MLLFVDKPSGYTSFDIVRKIKKLYKGEKVGHAGTLDPMATGLLIIGISKSTKLLGNILMLDKEYVAEIDFSKKSDTWDLDYREYFKQLDIDGFIHKKPSLSQIKSKLKSIVPEYELPLPAFSAKKVKGKKLYDLARQGEDLKLTKFMKVYDFEIIEYNFPVLKLRLTVGSGTYIRSIAYWLGKEFGLGGILVSLKRTRIGSYSICSLTKG